MLKIISKRLTKKIVLPMKIHNKLLKSTTVADKTDLRSNFVITILTRTGLHILQVLGFNPGVSIPKAFVPSHKINRSPQAD